MRIALFPGAEYGHTYTVNNCSASLDDSVTFRMHTEELCHQNTIRAHDFINVLITPFTSL